MPFAEVTPHHDGAGVIDAIGLGVKEHAVGDRVWTYMTAAERRGRPRQRGDHPLRARRALADVLGIACDGRGPAGPRPRTRHEGPRRRGETAKLLTAGTDTSWQDYLQKIADDNAPIGRFAEPDEIANLFVFLCSPRASYMVGSTYYIDGGWLNVTT